MGLVPVHSEAQRVSSSMRMMRTALSLASREQTYFSCFPVPTSLSPLLVGGYQRSLQLTEVQARERDPEQQHQAVFVGKNLKQSARFASMLLPLLARFQIALLTAGILGLCVGSIEF